MNTLDVDLVMLVMVSFAAFERPEEDTTYCSFLNKIQSFCNHFSGINSKKANYIIHEYLRLNHDHQVEFWVSTSTDVDLVMLVPVAFAAFERPEEDATAVSLIEYKVFFLNILVSLIAKKLIILSMNILDLIMIIR